MKSKQTLSFAQRERDFTHSPRANGDGSVKDPGPVDIPGTEKTRKGEEISLKEVPRRWQ